MKTVRDFLRDADPLRNEPHRLEGRASDYVKRSSRQHLTSRAPHLPGFVNPPPCWPVP